MPPTMTPTQFADFLNSTRATILTGPKEIQNLVQRNQYPIFELMKGRSFNDIARSVPYIEDTIYLKPYAQTGPYTPGKERTITMGDRSQQLRFAFGTAETNYGWTEAQYKSNTNGGERERVKDYKKFLEMDAITSHVGDLDNALFRKPDSAKMEDAPELSETRQAYSVPCAITEDDPAIQTLPPGWASSKIMNVPTTEKGWKNQVVWYNPAKITDVKSNTGLLACMDEMAVRLTFKPPVQAGDNMQGQELGATVVCFTNLDGFKLVKAIKRSLNDSEATDGNLAADRINYNGTLFIWCPQLDTEPLDQTRATNVSGTITLSTYTNQPFPVGKPRFYYVSKLAFKTIFYTDKMMFQTPVMNGGLKQPDFFGRYVQSWYNNVCINRTRLGVIAPVAA